MLEHIVHQTAENANRANQLGHLRSGGSRFVYILDLGSKSLKRDHVILSHRFRLTILAFKTNLCCIFVHRTIPHEVLRATVKKY